MTSTSKTVYIDKLDDRANKYNNKYHSTIKMKSVKVAPGEKYVILPNKMKNLEIVGSRAEFRALSVAKFFSYLLYIYSNNALFTDWCDFTFPSNHHRYHIFTSFL